MSNITIHFVKSRNKTAGFTFTELMVALAIVCIVTVIAIASYRSYVLKGRRVDAINTLLSISLAEERYRANNTTYGTLAQVWGGVTSTSSGYYTLSISGVSGTAYTVTATASGTQANDSASGTSCATLTLSLSAGAITKSPSACWPS